MASGDVPKRHGTGGAVIVPYQTFDTADGKPLCLAPGNDRLWARCAAGAGPSGMGDRSEVRQECGAREVQGRAAADDRPGDARKSRADWIELFEKAGVPCAAVNDIGELADTPQFAASEIVQELPGGGPKVVGLPITFDRVRPRSARPSPEAG